MIDSIDDLRMYIKLYYVLIYPVVLNPVEELINIHMVVLVAHLDELDLLVNDRQGPNLLFDARGLE